MVEISAFKPGFALSNSLLFPTNLAQSETNLFANVDIKLERKIGPAFWLADLFCQLSNMKTCNLFATLLCHFVIFFQLSPQGYPVNTNYFGGLGFITVNALEH